jgi:hypothetical protein
VGANPPPAVIYFNWGGARAMPIAAVDHAGSATARWCTWAKATRSPRSTTVRRSLILFTQVWDDALDEVLPTIRGTRAGALDLARQRRLHAAGSEYTQAFEKPADCVRWLPWSAGIPTISMARKRATISSRTTPHRLPFDISRGSRICCKWTPGMRACLSAKLAEKIAKAVTGQTTMIDRMESSTPTAFQGQAPGRRATGNRRAS